MSKKKVTAKDRQIAKNIRNYEARIARNRKKFFLSPYQELARAIEKTYLKSENGDLKDSIEDLVDKNLNPAMQQSLFTVWKMNLKEFINYFVGTFERTLNLEQMQDIESKLLEKFLKKYAAETVTRVSNTTKTILKNRIIAYDKKGLSHRDLVKKIVEDTKGKIGKVRAGVIARTETSKVINATNFDTALKAGLKRKKWVHAGGGKEDRKSHLAMHGVTIKIKDKFNVPAEGRTPAVKMRFPKDPECRVAGHIVHCYCQILYS